MGEALALEWEWLRLDAEPPHINLPTTKSGHQNLVPLGGRLREQVSTPDNIARLKAERGRWVHEPLASGAPLQAVSRLFGHESVTTTARVYDWTDGLSFASWAQ